jgi:regulator of replication initiation timing
MIRYNTDCPYCHDIFDQYCNLFNGYKNCDKVDCEVLKMLKENERLKQENEQLKARIRMYMPCWNCKHLENEPPEICTPCLCGEVDNWKV